MKHNDEKALLFHENWTSLGEVGKLVFDESTNNTYGKFILEPLYKGFGTTIGHSMRRVLLSVLVNIAVYAVRIDGVLHEYETIRGVREDVLQILLNIKEIVFHPYMNEDICLELEVKGPNQVTAKDINTRGLVSIINPSQVICSLDTEKTIKIEFYLRMGRGFVSSENNFVKDLPKGVIFLDSNHSPIRNITYEVQNTRFDQDINYEKLNFELWTNGAIEPQDAVCYGAKILCEYYRNFINFDESITSSITKKKQEDLPEENPNFQRNVEELELSFRSLNCLKNADIKTIKELVMKEEEEVLKIKNFGQKSLKEIKEVLSSMGFRFGMTFDDDIDNRNEA